MLKYLAVSALLIVPNFAHAVASNAVAVQILNSDGTTNGTAGATAGQVLKTAWRTVIASPARSVKGLQIFNSSAVPMQLAVGPSGSEVVQFIIPAGTLPGGAYNGAPVGSYVAGTGAFYPLSVSQGVKIALRALNSDAAQGEVDVSAFFF